VFGCRTNRQAKYLYKAYESIITNSQLNRDFKAMDMPNPPHLIRARLLDSCDIKKPETFFAIFIGDD
jgi:hypothetical protein